MPSWQTLSMNSTADYRGLRVVHAADYQFDKDGLVFNNCDLKFNQGLIQNGCFVYPFSINDRARTLSIFHNKTWGQGKANRSLIQTCINVVTCSQNNNCAYADPLGPTGCYCGVGADPTACT